MRIVLLAAIVLSSVCSASDAPSLHIKGKLPSGLKYQLDIVEAPFVPPQGVTSEDGSIWGVDGDFPKTTVKSFVLQLGEKSAYIPQKYYTDISAVRTAIVSERKDGTVKVSIEGSDAAGGYIGDFLFRKHRLVERTMRVGEFSGEVWEKVVLHNDLMDHPEKY